MEQPATGTFGTFLIPCQIVARDGRIVQVIPGDVSGYQVHDTGSGSAALTPGAPQPRRMLPETISAADAAAMCPRCHALPAEPCKGQQAGVAAEYRQWGRLRLLARRATARPRGSSG